MTISNIRRLSSRINKKNLPFEIDQVWIDRDVVDSPQTIRILNKLKDIPVDVIENPYTIKHNRNIDNAKRQIFLTMHRGTAFKSCQGIGEGHLCCGYRIIDLVSGCPMDCSYCVLQSYLANNPITTVYTNIEIILNEVSAFLSEHPNRFYRIGTGELSDSLALDPIIDYASVLIPFFSSKRNAILELKTKTAFVDHLIGLKHRNRTVISWSVNTEGLITSDERWTATLNERLNAAQKVAAAGYGVGLHFDPIVLTRGTEDIEGYVSLMDKIFEKLEPKQISWVSLGLLRYPPELSGIATKRFPKTRIFTGELIPTGNKLRYPRFIREAALRPLWEKLQTKLPSHKIYLCMETDSVWRRFDNSVTSGSCIEKRLCNTENIAFDFRS